jgi:hypothetical protein
MKQAILGLAILTMVWCSAARADIIFTLGNHPQDDEQNILLNTGTTGSTVHGTTNQSSIDVAFSSTTDTLTEPSQGQARITAQLPDGDGLINNIAISIPDGTFKDLIINPKCPPGTTCGNAIVTAMANEPDGGTLTFIFGDGDQGDYYPLGNGENFLTIVASNGETLASVTIEGETGFQDLRQPRISGVAGGNPIPEPATMLLLGAGLIGLAGYGRKKFFKK